MDFSTGRMKYKQPLPPQLNGKQSAAASPAAALQLTRNANFKSSLPCSQTTQSDKITPTVGRAVNTLMGKNMQVSILSNWLGRNHSEFQYPYTYTLAIR